MPATAEELSVARSWIGSTATESDATFNERYDRLRSLDLAIVESLRSQITKLVESPASLRLPSGLSIDVGANIKELQSRLSEFLSSGGTVEDEETLSGVGVTKLVRPDYR